MTALEYFEHQRNKHMIKYGQAAMRGATDEELQNISRKIGYYSQAVEAADDIKNKPGKERSRRE